MCIDFREGQRTIDWLPAACTLTRNGTHNVLVYGTMFHQPSHQARARIVNVAE